MTEGTLAGRKDSDELADILRQTAISDGGIRVRPRESQ